MALRRRVILLNHFSPVLRHFSKSCGGSARPFPWFESPYACARPYSYGIFWSASLSCAAFFRGRRLRTGVFGHGGVQFQANVLSSGNGRSISRGSERRDPNTARTGRWWCGEIAQTCEWGRRKRGVARPWKGSAEGGEPSGVRRCAAFAEKLPVFLLFTGTFATKFALFFLVLRFFAR